MTVIDDDGNLFGVVNVVDALAVVLVLAVLVAGIAVVGVLGTGDTNGADDPENDLETRYATIKLGHQPAYVVDRVSEGDTVSLGGDSSALEITDVYVTPDDANDGEPDVTVRAEVEGELDDDSRIQLGGDRLRVGTELQLDTGEYATQGEVTDVDLEDPGLAIEDTPVLLETTVSDRTANELEAGDTVDLGPHPTATVTNVDLYPVDGDRYRAIVGAELVTLEQGSTPTYGTQPVTIGTQLPLRTDSYDLEAELLRRGTDERAGESATTDATIELESVSPSVAESLEPGMSETVRGETVATIQSVETDPADVVLESDDGEIHLREHPTDEDVTLEVELRTLETDTRVRFHGDPLREDESVTLEFDRLVVDGIVTALE